ncbi:hypothetical protein Taro_033304 [Colocasia esculenta]|uniref:Vesicle-associated membrane protein 724 n=1 Tax=Colocasia esculenta TaxID=4460 RepID=A0A843W8N5_COLES|nr:hypothetical protein [Colocasia esculenta]
MAVGAGDEEEGAGAGAGPSFIYSFVARGTVVLAEYTEFTGNFPAIAAQCLQKLPSSNSRFTYACDHHTFNFLVEEGYGACLPTNSERSTPPPLRSLVFWIYMLIRLLLWVDPEDLGSFVTWILWDLRWRCRRRGEEIALVVAHTTIPPNGATSQGCLSIIHRALEVITDPLLLASATFYRVMPKEEDWVDLVGRAVKDAACPSLRHSVAQAYCTAYCVVAKESAGKQISMAFLERLKADFKKRYGGGKAGTALAKSLNKEFGPVIKEHMHYVIAHAEEIVKLMKVKAQVSEVKNIMLENIEKGCNFGGLGGARAPVQTSQILNKDLFQTVDRGEKLSDLAEKTEELQSQAQDFKKKGTQIRRKMWIQNMKVKLVILGILLLLVLVVWVSVCQGFDCTK